MQKVTLKAKSLLVNGAHVLKMVFATFANKAEPVKKPSSKTRSKVSSKRRPSFRPLRNRVAVVLLSTSILQSSTRASTLDLLPYPTNFSKINCTKSRMHRIKHRRGGNAFPPEARYYHDTDLTTFYTFYWDNQHVVYYDTHMTSWMPGRKWIRANNCHHLQAIYLPHEMIALRYRRMGDLEKLFSNLLTRHLL